jgi:hypothetical protein
MDGTGNHRPFYSGFFTKSTTPKVSTVIAIRADINHPIHHGGRGMHVGTGAVAPQPAPGAGAQRENRRSTHRRSKRAIASFVDHAEASLAMMISARGDEKAAQTRAALYSLISDGSKCRFVTRTIVALGRLSWLSSPRPCRSLALAATVLPSTRFRTRRCHPPRSCRKGCRSRSGSRLPRDTNRPM